MNIPCQNESETEPMGIVISRGSRAESAPRFSAYIWGQEAPEIEAPLRDTKAA